LFYTIVCLFLTFILAIVLSVIQFTASVLTLVFSSEWVVVAQI